MQLSPDKPEVYNNIGIILSMKQQFEDAAVYYSKALEIKPDFASAHKDLGNIYVIQSDFERAVVSFTEALKYAPDLPDALNSLAWLLAVDKTFEAYNPQKAVQLATRACELTEFKEPQILDTLAVTYAAIGKFPEAVETAKKAVQLARDHKDKQLAERIQTRLKLYKNNRPYTETLQNKTSK
jgi:Tfp pilus assembly protein PilF